MDNPHFQRSILSCLKSLNFAAVRLQAEQVDESVGALAVEGYLKYHFELSDEDDEDADYVHSLHPKPADWLGLSSKKPAKLAFTFDSSGNSASEFTSTSESPISPESGLGGGGGGFDGGGDNNVVAMQLFGSATSPAFHSQGFHAKLLSRKESDATDSVAETTHAAEAGKVNLLHFAARGWRCSNLDVVKTLLDEGVNILTADSMGRTPLHYAASSLQMEVLRFVMRLPNVELNAQCKLGYTPLHCLFMARRGPRQSLGVYRRESLPQLKNENKKLVLDFLDILTIHDVSMTPWNLRQVDNQGRSLLHLAATAWMPEVTEFLVEIGNLSPCLPDKRGNLPFHYALATLDLKTCEYLLSLILSQRHNISNPQFYAPSYCLPSSMEDLITISDFYDGFSLASPMKGTPLLHAVFIQGLRSEDNPYTFQRQGDSCGALIYRIVKMLFGSYCFDANEVCKNTNITFLELVLLTAFKFPVQIQSFGVDVPKMVLLLLQNGADVGRNQSISTTSPHEPCNPSLSHSITEHETQSLTSPSPSTSQSLLKLSLLSRDLLTATLLYAAGASSADQDEEECAAISHLVVQLNHSARDCIMFKRFAFCFLCSRFHDPPSLLQSARRTIRRHCPFIGDDDHVRQNCRSGLKNIPQKLISYLRLQDFDLININV